MASRKFKGLVGLIVGAIGIGAGLSLDYEGTNSIVNYILNPEYSIVLKGLGTAVAGAGILKILYNNPKPREEKSEE